MRPLMLILLLMFALTNWLGGTTSAGSRTHSSQPEWTRYRVKKQGFSVLLPELPAVISRGRYRQSLLYRNYDVQTYVAYADGVVYQLISFANPNSTDPYEYFEGEIRTGEMRNAEVAEKIEVSHDGLKGTRYLFKRYSYDKRYGYRGVAEIYETTQRVFALVAIGKDLSDPFVERFLQSFELKDPPEGEEIGNGARLGPVDSEKKVDSPVLAPTEVSVKAMVLVKPEPRYTEEARGHSTRGSISLRCVFSATGRVTNIEVLAGLPYGLSESAVEVARKTFFIPAMKDGRFVSTPMQLEYNFNLY